MHRQFAMDGLGRLPSMHLRVATYHFPQTLSEIETWARRNLITNKSFALHATDVPPVRTKPTQNSRRVASSYQSLLVLGQHTLQQP